ncbi:hypothetical protein PTKIN_Ptkin13bG0039000 [Pterospermum kingtungense]
MFKEFLTCAEPRLEYFTIVVHHGGAFVYTPTMKCSGKLVKFFDLCHVEAMSMLEIHDMIKELGYEESMMCFWRTSRGALRADAVRQLINDFNVVNMVATIPRNRYLHMYLVGDGGQAQEEPHIQLASDIEEESGTKHVEETAQGSDVGNRARVHGRNDDDQANSDFHESDYDMEDDDDNNCEVNIDIRIQSDEPGHTTGNNSGNPLVGDIIMFAVDPNSNGSPTNAGTRVAKESDHGSSESFHSVHISDDDSAIMWKKFNSQIDMRNPKLEKWMLFSDR